MPTDYISYKETNYFSDFICNYLDEKPELKSLYHRFPRLENFKAQIQEKAVSFGEDYRTILAQTLKKQYQSIEPSESTLKNIESLQSSNTFTITTGHQLNLFTGPLYFIYKIISTISLTRQLKAAYSNYNFVPMYWMATEDHDFDEIKYFNFKGNRIEWPSTVKHNDAGAVGRLTTEGLGAVYDIISSEFGSVKHAKALKDLFKKAYLNHDNLADATRYLVNMLFREYGLVILDADDTELKRLFIPQMRKELLEQIGFETIKDKNKDIESLGYNIQVNPREINLFYLKDKLRERIVWGHNKYSVLNTDISWTKDQLLMHLEEYPERFSPNVIMRPLYQEVILPNLCYIGGGGELAYWFQLKSNFEAQNVLFPMLLLRNSVLIKTEKQGKKQSKLNISDKDLFLKQQSFINQRVRQISDIDINFSEQIKHLKKQFEELYDLAKKTDKSFIGAVKAQEKKQIKGLQHLEKRLLKAQKRQLADQVERAIRLQEQLFPNNSLQERYVNFSELYVEYGDHLIPTLISCLKPLKSEFLILSFLNQAIVDSSK